MSEGVQVGGHPTRALGTSRSDAWWAGPAATFAGLMAFVIYSTWAAFQGEHYAAGPYLSPFYSPLIFTNAAAEGAAHSWTGNPMPDWLNSLWPLGNNFSPAFLILAFPGAFRFTCYYYRKAYYRSFAGLPTACAVCPMQQQKYHGETRLLLFQNLHRYAMYFAVLFIGILTFDAIMSLFRPVMGPDGVKTGYEFGVGVGSLVMWMNVILLGGYTFGCHSLRHVVGGRLNVFSSGPKSGRAGHGLWRIVTWFNERHMLFAWLSLFWVGFTDFYVRMVSMGLITDLNTWGT